jgi:hypothetical protein
MEKLQNKLITLLLFLTRKILSRMQYNYYFKSYKTSRETIKGNFLQSSRSISSKAKEEELLEPQ